MIPFHAFVGVEDAPKLAFVMHGALGAGHNLRSLAHRLVEARTDYRIALIDLRYHGKSLGAPPPHKLSSCANDLFDLVDHLGRAPDVVIGHSLGGKIALEYGRRHEAPAEPSDRIPRPSGAQALKQVWTLDSDPGAQQSDDTHQVQKVLGALLSHPGPFRSRKAAVDAIRSQGFSPGLANWLGSSLERKPEGFTWRFELDKLPFLLKDYFEVDLWPFLEDLGQQDKTIRYELLLAEDSDRWNGSMRERADGLDKLPRIKVHRLPNSGHWVHVDNPSGLLKILAENLY